MYLSKRVQQLKASPIRRLNIYAEEAAKRGIKIHHLNIGQPDIETPSVFFNAIANCNMKTVKYEHSRGTKELIRKIQAYYKRLGLHYEEDEIIITNGGSEAILLSLIAIFDEGDEMLVAEPYYANYNSFYDILNIKRNIIRTYAEDGFHLPSRDIIEKSITKKLRGIYFQTLPILRGLYLQKGN